MKLSLTVTALDGTERVVEAGFSAQVQYEERSGRTITSWRDSPPGLRDWALLAWLTEAPGIGFREWTDSVEMVAFTGTGDANPTPPAVAPGPP